MSDTYDEVEKLVERVQRDGGTTHDKSIAPDQDFGKFSDLGHERLKHNSPEHYEGPDKDEYERDCNGR